MQPKKLASSCQTFGLAAARAKTFGEWVNLGANTNTSDLKNNYSNIRMKLNNDKETKDCHRSNMMRCEKEKRRQSQMRLLLLYDFNILTLQ